MVVKAVSVLEQLWCEQNVCIDRVCTTRSRDMLMAEFMRCGSPGDWVVKKDLSSLWVPDIVILDLAKD